MSMFRYKSANNTSVLEGFSFDQEPSFTPMAHSSVGG